MKLEYNLINGKDGLDESQYLFVGPKISELGTTIEGDSENEVSLYYGYGKLNIPDNIIEICDFAFRGCENFTNSLTIGNSVTTIGRSAFNGCIGFTQLTIGNSVTTIGESAFNGCNGLTSITCVATTPPTLGEYTFYDTNDCPIYVPAGSVDTYKAASGWSTYASRIQPITT